MLFLTVRHGALIKHCLHPGALLLLHPCQPSGALFFHDDICHLIVNDHGTKPCLTSPTLRFLIPPRKPRNQFPIASFCASSLLTLRKESYESRAPPRGSTLRSWHSRVAASDSNPRQDTSKRRGGVSSVAGEYRRVLQLWYCVASRCVKAIVPIHTVCYPRPHVFHVHSNPRRDTTHQETTVALYIIMQ